MGESYAAAALIGRFYAERNREYPLLAPVVSLGSAGDSGIRIRDPRVAPLHARIRCSAREYAVEAVAPKAATHLNGSVLGSGTRRRLCHGDVLGLAGLELQFVHRPHGSATRLQVLGGVHRGKRFRIGRDRVAIGRAIDNDIQFPDRSVSRHHCRVWHDGSGWLIEDVGSTNGTLVNGGLLTAPVPLQDGDDVLTGFSRFLFRTAGGAPGREGGRPPLSMRAPAEVS